jgi:hypothetical protein
MLCVRIPSLVETDGNASVQVSPVTQAVALMGIGILYCGCGHSYMSNLLLDEIGVFLLPSKPRSIR